MIHPHELVAFACLLTVALPAVTSVPDAPRSAGAAQRLALVVTRVVDGKGEPVPDAEVSLVRCLGERRFATVPSFTLANPTGVPLEPDRDNCDIVSARTDTEGVVTFPNVRVGDTTITVARGSTFTYLLRTVKDGYTRGRRMVTPHVARNDYDVVIYRTVGERMFELVAEAEAAAAGGDFLGAEMSLIQAIAMLQAEVAVRNLATPDALVEALRFLTYVQLSAGNDIAAVDTLDELLLLVPDDPYGLRTSGVIAVQRQEWDLARAHFGAYLLFHPDSADAHLMMGNVALETGDREGAVEHLEAAVELDPEEAFAYRSLGLAYERAGRIQEAVDSYLRYLQLAEEPVDALQIRATISMLRR